MKTFREYIYELCKNTDLKNEEDVLCTIKTLALKVMSLNEVALAYEDKLKDMLSYNEFVTFTNEQAKKIFKYEIDAIDDVEFKEFIETHFDEIIN